MTKECGNYLVARSSMPFLMQSNEADVDQVNKCVSNTFDIFLMNSRNFDKKKYSNLPRFERDELNVGSFLGKGSFNNAYEIRSIDMKIKGDDKGHVQQMKNKSILVKSCIRNKCGSFRYAIKCVKPELVHDFFVFRQAAADIVREGAILSSLSHPHIIKIKGISATDLDGFKFSNGREYFLVLDKLHDTLIQRITTWASERRTLNRDIFFSKNSKKKRLMFVHRLMVAYDLANAMSYLREKNIIYRDLKPDNIGFDLQNNVKLFDFGSARELTSNHNDARRLYHLTGCIGTPRYMAPEVARRDPYNYSIDVYSFSMVLWEICELECPFSTYTDAEFCIQVHQKDKRPKLRKEWPSKLRRLLEISWSKYVLGRPTFSAIVSALKEIICTLRGGDDTGLGVSRYERRSSITLVD